MNAKQWYQRSMSATSTSVFKTLSMADSCLLSLPSIFAAKSSSLAFSRPVRLNLSCAYSTSFSPSLSLKKKTHFPSIVAFVSQTEEENTATLEQEEVAEEVESSGEASFGEETFEQPSEDAKIFVGNLSYDVDSERLAMLFEESGVVEIAEVIYNRETDRSRGFGFVTFSSVEEAEKAVEKMNGYELDGRALTVNKAAKRGERVERPPRTFEPGFRVYVGNLSWDIDNTRLEQIFSEYGKVQDARVVSDRETGRSRGFGFVTMMDETEMNDAIAALDGQSIDGRSIKVNVAEQRPPRRF